MTRSFAIQCFSYLAVFISSFLMVRFAGVREYGVYVNIFNWITLFSIIGCFGMEDVVLAEIPIRLASGKYGEVRRLFLFVNASVLFFSFCCLLLFALASYFDIIKGLKDYRFIPVFAMVNIFLLAFITVNQQILQAFNRFILSQVADKIIKPVLLTIFILFFFLLQKTINSGALIAINSLALLICALLVYFFVRSTLKKIKLDGKQPLGKRRILKSSVYFLLISLLYLLNSRISLFILGMNNDNESVGILNIVWRLADFVLLPYVLLHNVVPQLFSRHFESDVTYRRKLFKQVNLLAMISAAAVFVVMILFGKIILGLYNESLVHYYYLLVIICFSQFLYSAFGTSSALLMMQGKQKITALVLLVNVTFSAGLYFCLIRWFGITGAAWAALISSLTYNSVLRWLVASHLKRVN